MTNKRTRWLQKRSKKLTKKGKTTRGNRRLKLLKKLESTAITIKLKKDEDGLYQKRWSKAEDVVEEINRLYDSGSPFKVYDLENIVDTFGRSQGTLSSVKGYYLRAEITDIGEVWVRFTTSNELWGIPQKKVEYGPRNNRLSTRHSGREIGL